MINTTEQTYKELPEFLKRAIEGEIKIATEQELQKAQERIEKRKSEIVAGVVLHVTRMIEMERMGEKLTITIKTS